MPNLHTLSPGVKLALSLAFVFVALTVFFHLQTEGIFFSPRNLSILLRQASIVAIIAGGMCMLIVMREIDLSVGSSVYLCGGLAAMLNVYYDVPPLICAVAAVVLGGLIGSFQGFWVVRFGIPSFIVTLAGMLGLRGIGLLASNAQTVAPVKPSFVALSESFVPPAYSLAMIGLAFFVVVAFAFLRKTGGKTEAKGKAGLADGRLPLVLLCGAGLGLLAWIVGGFRGIPLTFLWAVLVGFLLTLMMTRTTFGRNAYLIGANREAAEFAGIRIHRHVLGGFVIMGLLYGIGGVLLTGRLASAPTAMGVNLELDAIAAAVIGGTALTGGVGTVAGAMTGALLLTTIDNGMSLMNVSSAAQFVVKAAVLIGALGINAYLARRR